MISAEVPLAAPPERQLPKASSATALSDLWRSVQDNARAVGESARTARQAGATLLRSLGECCARRSACSGWCARPAPDRPGGRRAGGRRWGTGWRRRRA
jgi:hypothetical protein